MAALLREGGEAMENEILSVKLRELEDAMGRLRSRIERSQTASRSERQAELEAVRRDCAEAEQMLRNRMQFSRSRFVRELTEACDELERAAKHAYGRVYTTRSEAEGEHPNAEESILLAEYALDFAMQAANRALALSLEAMNRQPEPSEREETQ